MQLDSNKNVSGKLGAIQYAKISVHQSADWRIKHDDQQGMRSAKAESWITASSLE